MKRLTILRHAKTEKPIVSQDDRERSLLPEGLEEAMRLGAHLSATGFTADAILCSPARRTEQTLQQMLTHCPLAAAIHREPSLYLASPDALLKLVQELPDEADSALLVGHNPGLPQLCWLTAAEKNAQARSIMMEFAPCSLAEILFPIEAWHEATADSAQVRRLWPTGE